MPAAVIRHPFSATKPTVAWHEYYRKRNRLAVLMTCPPRGGRRVAALIYLWYLSYLVVVHRWRGPPSLHLAYRSALADVLHGRLGKRDLSAVTALDDDDDVAADVLPAGVDEVLLDVGDSAGDAFHPLRRMRQSQPAVRFYLAAHLGHYRRSIDLSVVETDTPRRYQAAVVDRKYGLASAAQGLQIFACDKDGLRPRSYRQWVTMRLLDPPAQRAAVALLPLRALRLYRCYRRRSLNP